MSVPADCVFGEDNVDVSKLDAGYPVYAGYYNSWAANMTALRARFPHNKLIGVAIRTAGMQGADAIDCEPGTLASDFAGNAAGALMFCQTWKGGSGVSDRPIVYCMGSWAQPMQDYLAARGYGRDKIYLWTAHYGYLHLCGPSSCALVNVQADATQYASGYNDWDVFRGYMVQGSGGGTGTQTLKFGDTGALVSAYQSVLNRWSQAVGFKLLAVDGVFGGATAQATIAFQKYEKISATGQADPATQKLAAGPVTPPPPLGSFSEPLNLKVRPGRSSFKATWGKPANAGTRPVPYQVYVYEGTVADRAHLVMSYPRSVAATTGPVVFQGGSLKRSTAYIVHVVAGTGPQARPWVFSSAQFRTG